MTIVTSCSWCQTANHLDEECCRGCGHHAHRPRPECRCEKCKKKPQKPLFPPANSPAD